MLPVYHDVYIESVTHRKETVYGKMAFYISVVMAVLGFAMGVITDILVNNVLRFIAKPEGGNDKWMMIPQKKLSSLFLNIGYAFVVLFFVYMFYNLVNTILQKLGGSILTVEPLLFALIYLGFDLLFIGMKKMMKNIISDAKKKV